METTTSPSSGQTNLSNLPAAPTSSPSKNLDYLTQGKSYVANEDSALPPSKIKALDAGAQVEKSSSAPKKPESPKSSVDTAVMEKVQNKDVAVKKDNAKTRRVQDYKQMQRKLAQLEQEVLPRAHLQVQKLVEENRSLSGLKGQLETYGATPQDFSDAFGVYQKLKSDPKAFFREAYAYAKENNYLDDDGETSGLTASNVENIINDRLAPIAEERAMQQQYAQMVEGAKQEISSLVTQFPDSRIHLADIVTIKEKFQIPSMREAYLLHKNMFHQRGLSYDYTYGHQPKREKPNGSSSPKAAPKKPAPFAMPSTKATATPSPSKPFTRSNVGNHVLKFLK